MIAVIAALLSSGGLLMWVQITNSEPAAPLAAAAVWSLCLAVSLSVLRLHPLSPAMVYLYVSGYPLYSSDESSYPWTRAVGGEDRVC